ncbi:hypothetical protein CORC01_11805 [Colletotrichum orchidophilum]|uniref:Uncharacterized protein n=1 Tax=Colletotrichum orchidophilum TaxID=1209926 RepID=A0A1G4AUV2_9PEZI|nr:uncharacterized protein CORC01_11805 [Colletotrichum orchidophilum]OHE92938.1 hypothetical protein CORC01_11805 [Colletotrichum orchidophilum]
MAPESTFLSLPRELRDEIYSNYVTTDCGYVCNSEILISRTLNLNSSGSTDAQLGIAGVLKRGDGLPIDLRLSLTCKLVAKEMSGLALRKNTIIFSTATSEELRILALHFDILIKDLDSSQEFLFHRAGYTIPANARDKLRLAYPQFAPLLDDLKEGYERADILKRRGPFGEAPSQYRAFCRKALATISAADIGRGIYKDYVLWASRRRAFSQNQPYNALKIAQCPADHWFIPSKDDMESLTHCFEMRRYSFKWAKTRKNRFNYRFSAAAVAIHFQRSMPERLRGQLRSIVLDEDHEAVAKPQCHALGLIPFCKQNPRLRIERRVNLWRNALQPDSNFHVPYARYQAKFRNTRETPVPWGLEAKQVTSNVSQWIMEALALVPAGMPPASFALVLDGQPVPQLCAEIFQRTIQRDVAWQAAWFESVDRGIVPATEWFLTRSIVFHTIQVGRETGYFYRGFPRAMIDVVEGNSIVKCNFDPGELWNVERIFQDHHTWTPEQWQDAWANHEPKTWFPVAPLPSFKALLEEDLVPRLRRKSLRQKRKQIVAERRLSPDHEYRP